MNKIVIENIDDSIARIDMYEINGDKEKRLQTPCEFCAISQIDNPSDASIAYWKSHGIDRNNIRNYK